MRTMLMIVGVVASVALGALGVAIVLVVLLGWWGGLAVSIGIAGVILIAYVAAIGPWHRRWGATDAEVARRMPGDDLLRPGAPGTTRAISIAAPPGSVWPWLVQIGYGRAGWYSYDWIDNDGKPSADRIVPEFQDLRLGDQIVMVPGMGPTVKAIEPPAYILSGGSADTWCLALYPAGDGTTRLVSRWRQDWPKTIGARFWTLLSDPGAFVMERRMLKGIKARAERRDSERLGEWLDLVLSGRGVPESAGPTHPSVARGSPGGQGPARRRASRGRGERSLGSGPDGPPTVERRLVRSD